MTFESGQKDAKNGFLPAFPGQLAYMQGYRSGSHYRRLAEIQRIRNLDAIARARDESEPRDPRDPRPDSQMIGRHAMFRDHNCSRCRSGELPCKSVSGNPRQCDWPHARND